MTDPPCEVSYTNTACLKNTVKLDKDDKNGSVPSFLFILSVGTLSRIVIFNSVFANTLAVFSVAVYFH